MKINKNSLCGNLAQRRSWKHNLLHTWKRSWKGTGHSIGSQATWVHQRMVWFIAFNTFLHLLSKLWSQCAIVLIVHTINYFNMSSYTWYEVQVAVRHTFVWLFMLFYGVWGQILADEIWETHLLLRWGVWGKHVKQGWALKLIVAIWKNMPIHVFTHISEIPYYSLYDSNFEAHMLWGAVQNKAKRLQ